MLQWLFKYPFSDYASGRLDVAHPMRIELVLLIVAAIAGIVWWFYRRERDLHSQAKRITLAALRVAGLALLGFLLMGPVIKFRHQDNQKSTVAIALDSSQSMGLKFGKGTGSRFEQARGEILAPEGPLAELSKSADVRLFTFGNSTRLMTPTGLRSLAPDDDHTNLAGAIKDISQACRGSSLVGIVLLTDGVDTSKADVAGISRYAASRGTAVHTVGFGSGASVPDLEVAAIRAPEKAQFGSLVPVSVVVNRQAVREGFKVQLFRGTVFLKELEVPASSEDTPVALAMNFVADHKGANDFRIEIPPVTGEQVVENNKRQFHIEVEETRTEVLFVEGSPRHEFAFIRRVMADNRFFKVVSLLRLGHKRYYTASDDESSTLSSGFPLNADELGRYKAIILSDVEAGEFSPQQLGLIADFVKTRGGGLLMLGGVNSFNLGGYAQTPLADLLPVSLAADSVEPSLDDREFTFKLTPEGAEHEILRLTADPKENLSQWELMPALKGFNPLYKAKPGAHVLAYGATAMPGAKAPVIMAVQDVGAGRVAAFASANSWRWKMMRPVADDTFQRFWSQMIRWLAAGSKEMISVSTDEQIASLRQPLTIRVSVLDKTHRPFNDAKVTALVKDPLGNSETLNLPWSLREDGVYQASYIPAAKGSYTVNVSAQAGAIKLEAPATSFVAVETSVEFAHPNMDAAALERIAKVSDGTVDLNGDLGQAVKAITERLDQQHSTTDLIEERELRDAPILLLAVALLWFGEWTMRRRSGLA